MIVIKILVEDEEQKDKFLEVLTEAEENGELGDYFTIKTEEADMEKVKAVTW